MLSSESRDAVEGQSGGRQLTSAHGVSRDGLQTELRLGRHRLVSDEPMESGGQDAGPSPIGYLAASLVACTTMTVRMYARRKGWQLDEVRVDVRAIEEAGATTLRRRVRLSGDLDRSQRRRIAAVVERTPMTVAIRDGLPIETTYRD